MIITLIIVSILIVSILGMVFISEYRHENLWFLSLSSTIASGIITLILLIAIVAEHTMVDRKIEAMQARREAIVYQMDHALYLGGALGEFNSKIISGRYYHDNPWTSWFSGEYYYKVDLIELEQK